MKTEVKMETEAAIVESSAGDLAADDNEMVQSLDESDEAVATGASQAASAETSVEPAASSALNGDYIFPDSSSRALTASEVAGLSKEQLRIARNEIFARHGYIFTTPEMKSYFESKSWYHGYIEKKNFDMEAMLSQLEKDNIKLIKSYE